MTNLRNKGTSRTAGDRAGHTVRGGDDGASPGPGGAEARSIKVQCPNPACGKVHAVKDRWAGKTGTCPDCGGVISVPNATTAPADDLTAPAAGQRGKGRASRAAGADGALAAREAPPRSEGAEVREVRAGCIGRGHAGKTALFRALLEGPVGDFFPSGLHADAGDPREVARMIREAEETQRVLEVSGLPATLQAAQIRYYLYDGEERRAVCNLREVIGQVLTHTLPDSAAELQARYAEYLKSLVNTEVLWAVVPCPPPSPSPRERRRYANDLRITLAYLREALRLRSLEQPVAVALVLSKIDTLFEDPAEARACLSDDVLRTALGPLVHLIDKSARVSEAAIIPVTAFGFGNAVLREQPGERAGAPPGSADEPFGPEPVWLLREGVSPHPFNLDTLFIWTLLFGLLSQAGGGATGAGPEEGDVCRMLRADLDAADPWLLSLKGTVADEAHAERDAQSRE